MPIPDPRIFRKRANWLIAAGTELAAPLLRLQVRAATGAPSPPAQWRKAIILGANHIGDLLFRSASLAQLKAGLPHCDFHYLAAPGAAEVLEGNPALASILPWYEGRSVPASRLPALRAMKFNAALCINPGAYWPELMLAIRAGIPSRVGYTHRGFSAWVTHPISIRTPQPFAAYFRDYVAELTGLAPDWEPRPVIHFSEADRRQADELWHRLGLGGHVTACFMTSRQASGVWPAANFAKTLQHLRTLRQTRIILCGAAGDAPLLEKINTEYGLHAQIAAGSLGIRALGCFLQRCSVVLTTDSGPRHIANAAGVPVVFVRNAWAGAIETGKYLDTEVDLCGVPSTNAHGGESSLAAIDPAHAAQVVAAMSRDA